MGKPISYDERAKIVERIQLGDSYELIATDIGRSISGVKKIWYAFKKEGQSAFHTNYQNCGRSSEFDLEVRKDLKKIRDNQQGAYYVHSKYSTKYPDRKSPSPSTLNRWWRQSGTARQKGRPSNVEKKMESTSSSDLASRWKRAD